MVKYGNSDISNRPIDDKVIELLRRGSHIRNFKITCTMLDRIDNSSVDDLLPKQSTSTIATESSTKRVSKRKANDETRNKEDKCTKCGCRVLRVVDNGRPDKRKVLECMRRDCLATLKFTDLPVGTVIGSEYFTPNVYHRDPVRMYYPSPQDIEKSLESISQEAGNLYNREIENDRGGLMISVPGQIRKAKLM